MEDLKIKEGDIGLFEFQIKRGVVDENEIEELNKYKSLLVSFTKYFYAI